MAATFLTARWVNLCLYSYAVPRELLEPLIPGDIELDIRDGEAWASLVAFDFLDTRVKGIRWPGHVNFPELNLRFYVRHNNERGVMFVREYVPRRAIATTARLLYNEPYACAPMGSTTTRTDDTLTVDYTLKRAGRTHRIGAVADATPITPDTESVEHWFKEHSRGYGVTRRGRTLAYTVTHPTWAIHPIRETTIDLDWATLYGPDWACMNNKQPASTILAAGSEVTVSPAKK